MIKLFIIEDHYLIVAGLKNIFRSLGNGIHVAGHAQNVQETVQQIREIDVDVIVLDLWIKDDDPVDNIRCLIREYPEIPVVILTVENSFFWQITMFQEGAKAYLLKSDSNSTIRNTLIQVARGMKVIPDEIQQKLLENCSCRNNSRLTAEEHEIVTEYTSGLALKEIAQKTGKSISSLEKKLQKIRLKANARNIPELIKVLFKRKEL